MAQVFARRKAARVRHTDWNVAIDGRVVERWSRKHIGPVHWQCPPVWSSPTTIWGLEGAGRNRYWLEREAAGGAVTGKRIELGAVPEEKRWPEVSALDGPFLRHIEVETEENSELRRLDLKGG